MKNTKLLLLTAAISLGGTACMPTYAGNDAAGPRNPDMQAYKSGTAFISAENVAEVEKTLQQQGYNPGPIDGQMNAQTEQALKDFQRFEKLQVTGVLDRPTVAALEKRGAHFTGNLGNLRDQAAEQKRGT